MQEGVGSGIISNGTILSQVVKQHVRCVETVSKLEKMTKNDIIKKKDVKGMLESVEHIRGRLEYLVLSLYTDECNFPHPPLPASLPFSRTQNPLSSPKFKQRHFIHTPTSTSAAYARRMMKRGTCGFFPLPPYLLMNINASYLLQLKDCWRYYRKGIKDFKRWRMRL